MFEFKILPTVSSEKTVIQNRQEDNKPGDNMSRGGMSRSELSRVEQFPPPWHSALLLVFKETVPRDFSSWFFHKTATPRALINHLK
jgi:hypothetical protein